MRSLVGCQTGPTRTASGFRPSQDIIRTFYRQNVKIPPDAKSLKQPPGGLEPLTTRAKATYCAPVLDAVQVHACVTAVIPLWAGDVVNPDGREATPQPGCTPLPGRARRGPPASES